MSYEDPVERLRRTRDGREGFCQMLTTTLLVGGTYPKWGTENTLTEQGTAFFKALDRLSFGIESSTSTPVFVDEITMPKRHDDEFSASPDWTLIFEDRIWMIELKTERGRPIPPTRVDKAVQKAATAAGLGTSTRTSCATPWPPKPSTAA